MLESIKTRLRAAGKLTPDLTHHIVEFERICLGEIRSEQLRQAVVDFLENEAPLDFFTAPASSSGRNHPDWQSLPGGILLNTTECCIGADRKIRIYPELTESNAEPKSEAHDVVYVATILSDTFKPEDAGRKWTEFQHHQRAAEVWKKLAAKHRIPPTLADRITSAITWHLGRFTPGWEPGRDPRSLDLLDFIVHELDMDFSNRRLPEVFRRRVGAICETQQNSFLDKQYESASSYFQHVEGKLTNLLVFFATLVVAVITACYYVGSSSVFTNMQFSKTPRAVLIGLVVCAFYVISLVFIGVYTELRARKILMLEQMAALREHEISAAKERGEDIKPAITMVSSVRECPPYLRRPSEDWYTLLLMNLSSGAAAAVTIGCLSFWLMKKIGWELQHLYPLLVIEGLVLLLVVGYIEFAWYTRFCFNLDLRREANFAASRYHLFTTERQSFPWPLRFLDTLAARIEKKMRAERLLKSAT